MVFPLNRIRACGGTVCLAANDFLMKDSFTVTAHLTRPPMRSGKKNLKVDRRDQASGPADYPSKPLPGRRILPVGLFLLCASWMATAAPLGAQSTASDAPPPAPVNASLVRLQMVGSEQSFVGTVTPIRQVTIGSAVDGRVVQVFVEEGDFVKPIAAASDDDDSQGFALVQLRTGTIQIQMDAAQVELANRQAALDELKASLPQDIEQAAATAAAAEARLRFAKSELERNQSLNGRGGGVSRSELDQAISAFQSETQTLAAAKSLLAKLKGTRESRLAQANTLVLAQQDAIRLLEDLKNKYTIRAPFEGVVTQKLAEVGQWISAGQDVAAVVQMDPIEVVISVPQAKIQEFQTSLDYSIANQTKLPAIVSLETAGKTLRGSVNKIVPQADLRSRAFPVKIRLANPKTASGHWLKPGMLVQVQVAVGLEAPKILVEKDTLVLNNDSSTLMVIDRTSVPATVRAVPVQTGTAVGGLIEVSGDVRPDDWVVIEGNERLRPGQAVRVLNQAEMIAETDEVKSQQAEGEEAEGGAAPNELPALEITDS